jgi:hypothetical protein
VWPCNSLRACSCMPASLPTSSKRRHPSPNWLPHQVYTPMVSLCKVLSKLWIVAWTNGGHITPSGCHILQVLHRGFSQSGTLLSTDCNSAGLARSDVPLSFPPSPSLSPSLSLSSLCVCLSLSLPLSLYVLRCLSLRYKPSSPPCLGAWTVLIHYQG